MTMYEAEMTWTETRNFTATVPIEVPDDIPEDKIEEWIEDNIWNEADPYSYCDDDDLDEIYNERIQKVWQTDDYITG